MKFGLKDLSKTFKFLQLYDPVELQNVLGDEKVKFLQLYNPVELVNQPDIWLSILDQAVVGEEDEEGAENNVEAHGIHVHISRGEPSLG